MGFGRIGGAEMTKYEDKRISTDIDPIDNSGEDRFDELTISSIKPVHNIVIQSPNGKSLTIDYGGSKLVVTGDLEYDKAAEQFFNALKKYFKAAIKSDIEKLKSSLLDLNLMNTKVSEWTSEDMKDAITIKKSDFERIFAEVEK